MKKNILIISCIVLAAVIIQLILSNLAVFEHMELALYDLRAKSPIINKIFGKVQAKKHKDIVIVAIDNYSKKKLLENPPEELGPWPWKRDIWVKILDFIEDGEPKAVMFDMVFENLSENTWHDRKFAQKLRKYDNVVLGTYLDSPKIADDAFAQNIEVEENEYIPTSTPLNVSINDKKLDDNITYYINGPVHDMYTEYNTIGVVDKVLDKDNSVRKNQPIFKLIKNGETYYMPSLAFAGFLKYMGEDGNIVIKNNKIHYKGRIIPINNKGIVNVSWNHQGRNYSYIPISKILLNDGSKDDLKPEFFKDKMVIIGKTAAGGRVDMSSIIDPSYATPEANAVALENYINDSIPNSKSAGKFISEVPKPLQFLITILACAIVGVLGWYSKSAFVGFLNGFLSILLYVLFCFWLFVNPSSRMFLPIVVPLYYLTITSGVVFAFKLYKEMNKKTSIMNIFGKFVSPNVLSTVLKNPEKMALKNTKKRISVLFCDVKDFSRMSERYEPEKLVGNLNELFKEIVNIIFENNGTVDKFIGDCIMAYWGDLGEEDHAYMAVKTALEIKKKVNELKIKNIKENKIVFDVKIGINTGEAILGLTGTEKIMSYTAMGDAVNVASRLESSCSTLGRDILIAKSTYKEAKDKIIVIEVGEIQVKGKYRKVEAFEPIGFAKNIAEENEKTKTELITDKK